MIIGLPKALLYYRYGCLWKTFFNTLGCDVIIGGDTNRKLLRYGIGASIDENCLPFKIFIGQVSSLIGKCDYILIPRYESVGRDDEFCVRFFGLYDIVRSLYPEQKILSCNIKPGILESEFLGFVKMGLMLGKKAAAVIRAYRKAAAAQRLHDAEMLGGQQKLINGEGLKILIAAQPYIIHDAYIGSPIIKMIQGIGGTAILSDYCDHERCRDMSKSISRDLYWIMNKEIIGAIALYRHMVDGIIMVTAFPCGTDALANELAARRVRDVPMIQIIIDDNQGEAGLQTRIESFMDILRQRKFANGAS